MESYRNKNAEKTGHAKTSSTNRLTAKRVQSILRKHDTLVSIEEAAIILTFMRKLADVTVNQYLARNKNNQ